MIKNSKETNNPKKITENIHFWKGLTFILFAVILLTQISEDIENTLSSKFPSLNKIFNKQELPLNSDGALSSIDTATIIQEVIPEEGVILPISWKDLGQKMIEDGVIDETKFRGLFGKLSEKDEQMLTGSINEPILMTQENSRFILDILWGFGLANKNDILENGEMTDVKYGGDASKFASTGGWSLAKGKGSEYYSKYQYLTLTAEQQDLVDRVSRNIYRPCCGNSTHFPDCNHGMAMLGLLELMAANNVTEKEMYDVALKVNSLWFPQTYIDLATYFKEQGKNWDEVDPKEVLGKNYSSSQGYQQTVQKIKSLPNQQQGGGGCGA